MTGELEDVIILDYIIFVLNVDVFEQFQLSIILIYMVFNTITLTVKSQDPVVTSSLTQPVIRSLDMQNLLN